MAEIITPQRCAVYTRKSTDEGLEKDFNSLDAQREAAENYIASQKHRGWVCLETDYSDGGFSGGSMERPALKRLLNDISSGKIDVVVVYKIDRLSRSLLDFAALQTVFDEHKVSFVSVTQEINTSSSSGRMMLNILMTFAQYEREIITERIRDKVAAAKRKGKHCGGPAPLGYASDPQTKKLMSVAEEVEVVRRIFEVYLRYGSARDVAEELTKEGVLTPAKVSRKGNSRGGKPFTPAAIYAVLSNPVYVGLVRHKEKSYPGEHEAIIDQKLWDEVHEVLRMNTVHDGRMSRRLSPLRGLIRCGYCDGLMIENFTKKSQGALYRYYICEKDVKRIVRSCPVKSVPVAELEKLLLGEIGKLLQSPTLIAGVMGVAGGALKSDEVIGALRNLRNVWEVMFPGEKHKFIHGIVKRMTVKPDEVRIEYNAEGLRQILREAGIATADAPEGKIEVAIPVRLKYNGARTVLVVAEEMEDEDNLSPLQKALIQGFQYRDKLESGAVKSVSELSRSEKIERAFLFRSLSLANLAPDLVGAIMAGNEPGGLTVSALRKGIPEDWEEQRRLFAIGKPRVRIPHGCDCC